MSVRLFQALESCNRFLFAHNLDTEPDRIYSYWMDRETIILSLGDSEDGGDDEEAVVEAVFIEQFQDDDIMKFADQDIVINEAGEAEIKSLLENPEEDVHTCCIRFQMVRPMTEDDVKLKHLVDLVNPPN